MAGKQNARSADGAHSFYSVRSQLDLDQILLRRLSYSVVLKPGAHTKTYLRCGCADKRSLDPAAIFQLKGIGKARECRQRKANCRNGKDNFFTTYLQVRHGSLR